MVVVDADYAVLSERLSAHRAHISLRLQARVKCLLGQPVPPQTTRAVPPGLGGGINLVTGPALSFAGAVVLQGLIRTVLSRVARRASAVVLCSGHPLTTHPVSCAILRPIAQGLSGPVLSGMASGPGTGDLLVPHPLAAAFFSVHSFLALSQSTQGGERRPYSDRSIATHVRPSRGARAVRRRGMPGPCRTCARRNPARYCSEGIAARGRTGRRTSFPLDSIRGRGRRKSRCPR